MFEIKVPELGESIQEVQISQWLKQEGEWVDKDEDLVELESEKAAQSLAAPEAGILQKILSPEGEFVNVGDVIARLEASEKPAAAPSKSNGAPATQESAASQQDEQASWVMPAAQRVLQEHQIPADAVAPSGPGGRLLKEDVLRYVEQQQAQPPKQAAPAAEPAVAVSTGVSTGELQRQETVKPMSMIRRTIAGRLVEAQHQAALLTTFNEIDMLPVSQLRRKYKEPFLEKHGVKLGFMSFFAKAAVESLKRFPAINSEIRGNDIVSRNYYDIGVAIGGGKGLVVPVLRNVERLSFAEVERQIGEFAKRAQENRIKPEELEGGTFTISNGGVYGSLLSTPIVNPPQSGILGLHAIQERPVAIDGQVVIRPMMYIALTYDHRMVDGREAVGFLRGIKEVLEEPARLFLEV